MENESEEIEEIEQPTVLRTVETRMMIDGQVVVVGNAFPVGQPERDCVNKLRMLHDQTPSARKVISGEKR